ncbi:sigma-54-dependent transcriptional regulator [Fibrobacterota bacterium]
MRPPNILIVEDDDSAVFGYTQALQEDGYSFKTASNLKEAEEALKEEQFDAVLLDLNLPDGKSIPLIGKIKQNSISSAIIVITGDSEISTAVEAMKQGADNYLVKPVDMDDLQVQLKKFLEIGGLRKKEDVQKNISRKGEPHWGRSPSMRRVLDQVETVAGSDTPVLIQGETGTGKGVLAKWLHARSKRRSSVFIDLNCSTFKGDLLRSELFGHVRGAFTSSIKDRIGLIEAADGGTLFLDEIGDMDNEVQTQLLKVIEEKTFRRLGENKTRKSDFRLICATHKDINKTVKDGSFREDLFFRISVFPIHLPPLRERKDDIAGLSERLLVELGYTHGALDNEVLELLKSYDWPGNVRELKNGLERALLVSKRNRLNSCHFPDLHNAPQIRVVSDDKLCSLEEMEIIYIKKALELFNGDKNKVCEALGISMSSLYRKIPRLQTAAH